MQTWTIIATLGFGIFIGMILTGAAVIVLFTWYERDKEEAKSRDFDRAADEAVKLAPAPAS